MPQLAQAFWRRFTHVIIGKGNQRIANEIQTMAKPGTGFGAILCYLRAFALVDVRKVQMSQRGTHGGIKARAIRQ
ncbi:hypothetical protein M621_16345 [Serratia plymuthica S13]|uniref:Uncharacterized protein n=1 Tax=Serratia plymuthica S13 TaxID=1348660 RepID=S4YX50_SERPL|nr:hypothetical protein M621_16345 [Serratia plymuthica S13]